MFPHRHRKPSLHINSQVLRHPPHSKRLHFSMSGINAATKSLDSALTRIVYTPVFHLRIIYERKEDRYICPRRGKLHAGKFLHWLEVVSMVLLTIITSSQPRCVAFSTTMSQHIYIYIYICPSICFPSLVCQSSSSTVPSHLRVHDLPDEEQTFQCVMSAVICDNRILINRQLHCPSL